MNGVSWVPPDVPVLLQILHGTTNPADLLPKGSVYSLPGNSVVELSMPGGFPVSIALTASYVPSFKQVLCLLTC